MKFNIALLIENRLDRALLTNFLSQLGHNINESLDSQSFKTSMIITDVINARKLTKKILQIKHQSSPVYLPVIIFLSKTNNRDEWLQLGFDDVIYLPSTKAELENKLNVLWRLKEFSQIQAHIIFDKIHIGIYRLRVDGRILSANPALIEVLGYQKLNEIIDKKFESLGLKPNENRANFYNKVILEKTILGHQSTWKRKKGELLYFRENVTFFQDKENKISYFIGTLENCTQQKLQEKKEERLLTSLKNSNDALEQFAYIVSHDLRAPLRGISHLVEWIKEDMFKKLTEQSRKYLDLLTIRVKRLDALITGILNYSKVSITTKPKTAVDVNKLLVEVIDNLSPTENIKIIIDNLMPTISANKTIFSQVFLNLISNAIRHHDKNTIHIHIGCKLKNKFYQFYVKDDGPGIDPIYHNKIFEIFQTLVSRDTLENTGIALTVIKKIVEQEGGTIWLESELGKGSIFYFTWKVITSCKS